MDKNVTMEKHKKTIFKMICFTNWDGLYIP